MVKELVVELEHAELCQLVDHDPHLEGAVNYELALAKLDLVGVTYLLEVGEPGRAEMFVHLFLISGVQGFVASMNLP